MLFTLCPRPVHHSINLPISPYLVDLLRWSISSKLICLETGPHKPAFVYHFAATSFLPFDIIADNFHQHAKTHTPQTTEQKTANPDDDQR